MKEPVEARPPNEIASAPERLSPWSRGLLVWLVFGVPVIQALLVSKLPDLRLMAGGDSSAWWRLALVTVVVQWSFFGVMVGVIHRDGLELVGLGFRNARWRLHAVVFAIVFISFSGVVAARHVGLYVPPTVEGGSAAVRAFLPTTTGQSVFWLLLALTAAVCEESLYRGFLITYLRKILQGRAWIAVLVSAAVFALAHQGWAQSGAEFAGRTLLGVVMGGLYVWRKNLFLPILLHFMSNGSVLLISA